jgi:hypothetical protein
MNVNEAAKFIKEGRFDILKNMDRAYADRANRSAMGAILEHAADQYRTDMRWVKVLLEHAKVTAAGDSVILAAIAHVGRIYPLAGVLCAGCNVRVACEHRCLGGECPCCDCLRD